MKRLNLATEGIFVKRIQACMHDGPLRNLALDMYRALFRHPGTLGTMHITNAELEKIRDDDIAAALRALPEINNLRDSFPLRNGFASEITKNLFEIVARHRDVALEALNAA